MIDQKILEINKLDYKVRYHQKKQLKFDSDPTKLVNDTLNVPQSQKRPKLPLPELIPAFLDYCERLHNTGTIVTMDDGSVNWIDGAAKSRYFVGGRRRMQRNIKKRLGSRWYSAGVLATFTYDPKIISREQAWENISKDKHDLIKAFNMRKYRNHSKGLKYLWAVENQPGTGYPHIHIFFPNLNYLMPNLELTALWGHGSADARHKDNVNCASYLCKYLAKLEDWDIESQAQIWQNHTRVYGYSVIYKLPQPDLDKIASGSYGGSYKYKDKDGKNELKQILLLNRLLGGYHLGIGWGEFIEPN